MAGGQGTKLWPMSKENLPKQFQKIIGDKTLFRTCLEGLLEDFVPRDILVSTKKRYKNIAKEQAPEIPNENFIIEPDYKKNQGPATIYAMLKIKYLYPEEPCMLVQSDVVRNPRSKFNEMIKNVETLLNENPNLLLTTGYKPPFPEMGADYLEIEGKVEHINNLELYKTKKFINRLGDYEKTKELLSNYHVLTHNNHYTCYPDRLMQTVKKHKPKWYEKMMKIFNSFGKPDEKKIIEQIYSKLQPGPIEDVTKHIFAQNGKIIIPPFQWRDIGTWDAIYQYFTSKPTENYKDGKIITIDSKSNLIKGSPEKIVATIGLNNMVIVDTPNALLICDKNRTAEVKKVIKKLKKNGDEEYL